MTKKVDPEVEESTEYYNAMDLEHYSEEPPDLLDFLGVENDSDNAYKHWVGMPEFKNENNPPYKKLIISFRTKEDYEDFAKVISQNLTEKTKSIWHPKLDKEEISLLRWVED